MADQFADKFRPKASSGPLGQITELKDLVTGYAKQQTIDPLKTLGRYLSFGFAGSMMMGLGFSMLLLALLRGLQQFTVFNDASQFEGGRFSWVPYFLTATVGIALVVIFFWRLLVNLNKDQSKSAKSTRKVSSSGRPV